MAKSLFENIIDRSLTILTPEDLSKVKYIGDYAFKKCQKMQSIDIPLNVLSIGYYAFSQCNLLTVVNIPSSVKSIGNSAFTNCPSLETVNIAYGTETISERAFSLCSKLTTVNLPNSLKTIGESCFTNTQALKSITIPSSVENIGALAFSFSGGAMKIADAYFNQPSGMMVNLPTAGSDSGMFYVKTARNMNVYTDNETIKNYDYASDNITPTFYHLDGTAW